MEDKKNENIHHVIAIWRMDPSHKTRYVEWICPHCSVHSWNIYRSRGYDPSDPREMKRVYSCTHCKKDSLVIFWN